MWDVDGVDDEGVTWDTVVFGGDVIWCTCLGYGGGAVL